VQVHLGVLVHEESEVELVGLEQANQDGHQSAQLIVEGYPLVG
jgi:hypothetical protein